MHALRLAALCWAILALAPPASPIVIDEDMLISDDPRYQQCLQLFLDFSTALASEAYLTECYKGSDNITLHCFSEYSSLCGPGELPAITTTCEPQLDSHSGKKNVVIRPLNRKKAKCIARVLIVMMSNNNVGLCTALQLCSEGHKAPQCKERYTLFKESLQQFCLFPGLPVVTPGTIRRKIDMVAKCKGDVEKCSSTVKILSGCLAVAGLALLVIVAKFGKKWVAALRDRRGRYTLADYVPPINTATSATRLGPDYPNTPDCDEICSYLSQEGASKWSEFSSTPKSRLNELVQERKRNQQMSLTTTLESSYSEGEVCSSCCNYGSTNPDSSESKPSAVSESELVTRRPGRCAEFPHSPVGRGVGSSLGRGYYSESGTARLTVCERAQAWRNMVAHRLQAHPPQLSSSLPSKISQPEAGPVKRTENEATEKTTLRNSSSLCSQCSGQSEPLEGEEKLADGTRAKRADLWVKRTAEEQKSLEDKKDGKPEQNGISKPVHVFAKVEIQERGRGCKQPDMDQPERDEKPGPSRMLKTERELKDVRRARSAKKQKISANLDEIESVITTV